MNFDHTITFEEVSVPGITDPEGNVIVEATSYESFVLRIYNLDDPLEGGAPHIYQPMNHNTGEPFASEEDAEAWYQWYMEFSFPSVVEETPTE